MTVYSDRGWMGPICSFLGLKVSFTRLGVLIAMIFVSLPFVVRTIQPVLYAIEKEVEEAAWCLGASEWITFWWIIFPSLTSSLLTGTTLAFSRAIGEYGSIVLVAGNIPKQDLVISVLIFQRLEQYDHRGAISIAVLVLSVSFLMLLTINSIQTWKQSFRK
jgi:sulfate transport system permease protein